MKIRNIFQHQYLDQLAHLVWPILPPSSRTFSTNSSAKISTFLIFLRNFRNFLETWKFQFRFHQLIHLILPTELDLLLQKEKPLHFLSCSAFFLLLWNFCCLPPPFPKENKDKNSSRLKRLTWNLRKYDSKGLRLSWFSPSSQILKI